MYDTKELSWEEFSLLFEYQIKQDFPEDEIKPKSIFRELWEKKKYRTYGYYKGDELHAYAFFVIEEDCMLLDYLAVKEEHRMKKVGSSFLQQLTGELAKEHRMFLEVENPDYAVGRRELEVRKKRIEFYKRNGWEISGMRTALNGVEYRIMQFGGIPSEEGLRQDIHKLYHTMFPPEIYRVYVRIY